VNHPKYIVTDERINIGTSNMDWGYFYNSGGMSFNSDHAGLRDSLQASFDRDWDSPYAHQLGG
jgi:phospholipase D3/4